MNAIAQALAPLEAAPALSSIRRHAIVACAISLALVGGLGGWAIHTQIAGAVIASGQLVVESDVKKVQHPTGGVVAALYVRDGDAVRAGELLIRLDETQTRAGLDIVVKAMDELLVRRARNEAERDNAREIAFPRPLLDRSGEPTIAALISGERNLFDARVQARTGQRAQLRERVLQLRQEIEGLRRQADAKEREIALITTELNGVRALYAKNLVQLTRLTALERDAARLEGERGQLIAALASTNGKIAETELQILQIDQNMFAEVNKELSEIRSKWSELGEKRIAAEDMLKRIEMRAPQDGVVHQLSVHTVGGLVVPHEPAMLIVPVTDQLAVEAKVQPQDIDNVRIGQKSVLRFSAFNMRTTPEIGGSISRVSADVTTDPKTGASFYVARIQIPESERARLGGLRLLPGMPVETHMLIGDRTAMSFLTKPIVDQVNKAWRER